VTTDRDALYLEHIAETVDLIRATAPRTIEQLAADPNLRDATLYRLQTLSESANLLSEAVRVRHPDIPWAGIAGFRNRLAHGYVDVKLDRVSQVIDRDLAPLREAVGLELGRDMNRDTGLDIGF
jgi:uncharacterized protein with HEPN domain